MDAQLNDNVQIQNKGGSTLVTESLNWQSKKNHVETDDRVKVTKDSMEITSEGMSADTLLQDADFKKDVEVVFPDPETQEVSTITCDGLLEIEYELGKAVFNDNVVALHTQGKIFADKLTLYFDTETNTIKQMVSEGNVKIVKGNNISFADKATYIGKTQKLILEGRPRLVYFPEEDSEDDSPF
jgi:lipopolysaccharide export system protein LptA